MQFSQGVALGYLISPFQGKCRYNPRISLSLRLTASSTSSLTVPKPRSLSLSKGPSAPLSAMSGGCQSAGGYPTPSLPSSFLLPPSPSHCGGWVCTSFSSIKNNRPMERSPWALNFLFNFFSPHKQNPQAHPTAVGGYLLPRIIQEQAMERLFDKRPRLKVGSYFAICGEEKQGPDIKGCVFG